MADLITLTTQPIRITALSRQAAYLAVDVGSYDLLDLELVCSVEGTATSAQINLFTGMQIQTDDGWFIPSASGANFGSLSGSAQVLTAKASLTGGFLRYLRWDCSSGTSPAGSLGGATALTFFIRGMARSYCR